MVVFFVTAIICVVVGYIIACRWEKSAYIIDKVGVMIAATIIGIILGVVVSFWGGSFVKKEIVVEKYFISPMFFDEKPIAGLMEEHDSVAVESDNYVFQVREGDKTKFIKHYFKKEDIFFSLNEGEERFLEIKRWYKTCGRNMRVWFFYENTGLIESKVVLKKGDSFLILPRYYSL